MMAPIYLLVTLLDAGASSDSLERWPAACWWSCTPSVLPFITLNFYCTPVEWLAGWSGGKSWLAEEFCIKTSTMVWSMLWAHEVLEAWPWRVLNMGCWSPEPALCGVGPDISLVLALCPMNQKKWVQTVEERCIASEHKWHMYCLSGNKCSVSESHMPETRCLDESLT